jgi:hypothetical protein
MRDNRASLPEEEIFLGDIEMTYDQKKNRLFIVASYAIVHRIPFADAIAIFARALDKFERTKP